MTTSSPSVRNGRPAHAARSTSKHSTRGQLLAVKDRIDQMLQQFDLTDDEREASKETA
ncbi:hypothetical protein M8I34_27040 [Streptomyces sp. MCA2]|uniref:hypothetical protein n=1 Tax=Streptomyces sp. MCA2 TaxID=2944805 RepID=UPI002021B364|nr:hypothetical protein [Streptomyces sp. MCA2]MCL7495029.1 hypothetical protein [Streptomyces sp. MCA2]